MEEERRLAYVAITRARKELFITWANQRKVFGKTEYHRISMFAEEIPEKCIEDITPREREEFYYSSPFGAGEKTFKEKPFYREVNFATFSAAKNNGASFDFVPGDRVRHKKFGDGTISEAQAVGNDMRLKIVFDNFGEKNLMAVYAKLEKISE